jgi:hypothetical protein
VTKSRKKRPKVAAPRLAPSMPEIQMREVDDPDFSPHHEIGYAGNRKTAKVAVNVRESAVETLFARRFLATSQKRAADHFREIWEAAGGKTASLDYTLDRVDGGRGDPAVTRLRAAQELKRCRDLLGARGYEAVTRVCAEGRALAELTPHKRERLTMADNLRADLDDLASMWGYQTRRKR